MKLYTLDKTQFIKCSIEEAWDFLSDPKNLKTITPDYMGFNITSGAEERMFAGQVISYKVTPLLGIPMNWVTVITHVEEPNYFVDEQRFGPYAFWHHKHFLKEVEGGVEMRDVVHYGLPLGFLGRMVHPILVRSKLEEIFNYRIEAVDKRFNQ